jgi:hypothetical protein
MRRHWRKLRRAVRMAWRLIWIALDVARVAYRK